jgi:hypothetical protein
MDGEPSRRDRKWAIGHCAFFALLSALCMPAEGGVGPGVTGRAGRCEGRGIWGWWVWSLLTAMQTACS